MATNAYQLDLDHQKRNVFVTQLHQREDDEEEVNAFPVVKESAGKLIETGINTLQKTLLLKKEVEVDHVHTQLLQKRAEFKERMEQCAERQIDVQKKQQKMKDRVTKFEKFIKENEAKRRRAIQKYQMEVRLREQKNFEYEEICLQLQELKDRHEYLRDKLAKYKQYEVYLLRVLDILPAHYLEVNDTMLNSLMMRHRTLSETNHSLVTNLMTMSDEFECLKVELDEMQQEHNKQKLSINSQLSLKQKKQEEKLDQNQEKEQVFGLNNLQIREQRAIYGQIMMAIDNIAEKCRRKIDAPTNSLTLDEKLEQIKDYINEREDVAKLAAPDAPDSPLAEHKHSKHGSARHKVDTFRSAKPGYS